MLLLFGGAGSGSWCGWVRWVVGGRVEVGCSFHAVDSRNYPVGWVSDGGVVELEV